jgi:NADPH:quinone reductase-like Zn-dependent oxidoreductase
VDFAGTVEVVGKNVTLYKLGDEVFGGRNGAFAEYVVIPENRAVLAPEGRMVLVGGPPGDWIGFLGRPIGAMLLSPFVDQEFSMLLASLNPEDLATLGDMMASGEVTPAIDIE